MFETSGMLQDLVHMTFLLTDFFAIAGSQLGITFKDLPSSAAHLKHALSNPRVHAYFFQARSIFQRKAKHDHLDTVGRIIFDCQNPHSEEYLTPQKEKYMQKCIALQSTY